MSRSEIQEQKRKLNADRWKNAVLAAEKGDFDSIPPELWTKYHNNYKRMRADYLADRELEDLKPDEFVFEWWYGPRGSGKSMTAIKENPGAYFKDLSSELWDGYNDQEVVIFDNVKHDSFWYDYKRCLDPFVFSVEVSNPNEVEGGWMVIRPKKIIVISNYLPEQIWRDPMVLSKISWRLREYGRLREFGTF